MSRKPSQRRVLLPLFLMFISWAAAGCTLYSDIREATRDTSIWDENIGSNLTMQVVLTPVQNRTSLQTVGHPAVFSRTLKAALSSECARTKLISLGDPGFPAVLDSLPETRPGITDNQAIAEIGRRLGINAVVTATVFDISGKSERRGILWFRESRSYVQFNVGVAIFDMETGAKVLDEAYEDEIEIDPFDLEALEAGRSIENPDLEEALKDGAEELAEAACDRIADLPWKGFLVSVEDLVQISAGKSAGIAVGDRFDVRARGKEMEGLDGQRFYLPGKKIARIEVVSVLPNRATAEVVSAKEPLVPGYTVLPVK
jgi:hypothetical protein